MKDFKFLKPFSIVNYSSYGSFENVFKYLMYPNPFPIMYSTPENGFATPVL
jgi:hypothetical protein